MLTTKELADKVGFIGSVETALKSINSDNIQDFEMRRLWWSAESSYSDFLDAIDRIEIALQKYYESYEQ